MNDDIFKFFNSELNQLNEQDHELKNQIRECQIQFKYTDKKMTQIRKCHDDTLDYLTPASDQEKHFDYREIEMLQEQKDRLENHVVQLEKQQNVIQARIDEISALLNESNLENNQEVDNPDHYHVRIQEMDRERISRDIHDGVVQNLSALLRKMEFISKILDQEPVRAKIEIDASKTTLKESIQELRDVIYDLRPMELNDLGLESAFYNLCETIKRSYDGTFNYSFYSEEQVSDEDAINILRIIKELCSNSIKYSNGNFMKTDVRIENHMIHLIHMDDGTGFQYYDAIGTKENHTGFGLLMLNERVNLYHGSIDFHQEGGSTYVIKLPMTNI